MRLMDAPGSPLLSRGGWTGVVRTDGPRRSRRQRWGGGACRSSWGFLTEARTIRHASRMDRVLRVGLLAVAMPLTIACTKPSSDDGGDGAGSSGDAGDSGDDGGFIPNDLVPEPSECSMISTVDDCLAEAFDARQACKDACTPAMGCELDACEAVCFSAERMARTACYVDAGSACADEVTISMCIQGCETAYGECIAMTDVDCYAACDPAFTQCSTDCGTA